MINIPAWLKENAVITTLFVLFTIANVAYLGSVPGLMGDEASEGHNVYEKIVALTTPDGEGDQAALIRGERSYIGPAIDYVRIPFIGLFGYSTLGIRVPMLLASLSTFALAASVFNRLFGTSIAPTVIALSLFSPVYLGYQRLGWTITLFPFFTLLILWLLMSNFKQRALLVGFAAGLALHNHVLFLPTLLGLAVAIAISSVYHAFNNAPKPVARVRLWFDTVISYWPAVIGFAAGFSTQLYALLVQQEDQGNIDKVAQLVEQRWEALRSALTEMISGSAVIARYVGEQLPRDPMNYIFYAVIILSVAALILSRRKWYVLMWLLGLYVHLAALLYVIEHFSIRYMVISSLALLVLAGVGIGEITDRLARFWKPLTAVVPIATAIALLIFTGSTILIPFLQTGGQAAKFSFADRTENSSALVATEPLVDCIRGAGPVYSEDVHIYNRLVYLSHQYNDITVVLENQPKSTADWQVIHGTADSPTAPGERCPQLDNWRIVPTPK